MEPLTLMELISVNLVRMILMTFMAYIFYFDVDQVAINDEQ